MFSGVMIETKFQVTFLMSSNRLLLAVDCSAPATSAGRVEGGGGGGGGAPPAGGGGGGGGGAPRILLIKKQ